MKLSEVSDNFIAIIFKVLPNHLAIINLFAFYTTVQDVLNVLLHLLLVNISLDLLTFKYLNMCRYHKTVNSIFDKSIKEMYAK